jgi:hypothetical protein
MRENRRRDDYNGDEVIEKAESRINNMIEENRKRQGGTDQWATYQAVST